jgi:hypothetical protein
MKKKKAYLHVSESPRVNPVELVVREVGEDQVLQVLQDPDVEP